MPKAKIGRKTLKATDVSTRATTEYINDLRKKENTGSKFMAKVTGLRGDGRFVVSGPGVKDLLVHLSGALRIKKGDTRKFNVKVAIGLNDNILVDGDIVIGVFSPAEASQVNKLLKLNNNNNNIFNRGNSTAHLGGKRRTYKK
jgi:hypothetical protein